MKQCVRISKIPQETNFEGWNFHGENAKDGESHESDARSDHKSLAHVCNLDTSADNKII